MSEISKRLMQGTSKPAGAPAALVLEDGAVFRGTSCAAAGEVFGEICFNTSLEGYLEVITDPSYAGQIVTMTYPQIGNYGVNVDDVQADEPALRGLVVRDLCATPSNWRSAQGLPDYLRDHGVVAVEGVDTRALVRKNTTYMKAVKPKKKERAFVPAGQSTQMIVGASPESDFQILNLSAALYRTLSLKRVFFSAYTPVNDDKRLPGTDAVQLNREHRLYQADWLLRFYRFDVTEIIDEDNPFLDPDLDPKANWAINHLDFFPVEVNTAPLEALLRVPGIGVRGANLIVRARRTTCLREPELRKLGIAYKRARFFITCSGSYSGRGVDFSREGLRAQLAAPIKGGNHGRRADKTTPGQMSLFESVETPEKARIAGGSGARALESGDATAAASCSDAERSSNAASSSGRAASADGTYGWQRALETPEAVCA